MMMVKVATHRYIVATVCLLLCAGLCLCAVSARAEAGLTAGAAVRVITPEKPAYLAGTDGNRIYTSIHDDLYAHCLYLNDGDREVTIVSLDLLGFLYTDVQTLRNILKRRGFNPDNVFIASTHTHTAPDAIGFWGPSDAISGRDSLYIKKVYKAVVECSVEARETARPVEVGFAAGRIENACKNIRDPGIQDDTATVMQLRAPEGPVVSTLVNYGCHPEALLDTTIVSSDFVSVMYTRLAEKTGGKVMFLNGALGGMVTPIVSGSNWPEAERVGNLFTDQIEKIMDNFEWVRPVRIFYAAKKPLLPCMNQRFAEGLFFRGYARKIENGAIETEMMHMRIGPADFISMPGETLPDVGLNIKDLLKSKYKFLISLVDDEIGYILPKEEYDPSRYEESLSMGPDTAPMLYEIAKELTAEDFSSNTAP
jgi:hypothetical protein